MLICEKKLEELKAQAPYLRYKHPKSRLSAGLYKGDEKSIVAIKKILLRENVRRRLKQVGYSTKGRGRGRAVCSVRVTTAEGE